MRVPRPRRPRVVRDWRRDARGRGSAGRGRRDATRTLAGHTPRRWRAASARTSCVSVSSVSLTRTRQRTVAGVARGIERGGRPAAEAPEHVCGEVCGEAAASVILAEAASAACVAMLRLGFAGEPSDPRLRRRAQLADDAADPDRGPDPAHAPPAGSAATSLQARALARPGSRRWRDRALCPGLAESVPRSPGTAAWLVDLNRRQRRFVGLRVVGAPTGSGCRAVRRGSRGWRPWG
jgi:hypothetical protein